ncbi:MAG: hypothetical protein HYZ49_11205 [Chloroflexi bacterium]|nr:hypothetical protein [Chloroflexota bacterium]
MNNEGLKIHTSCFRDNSSSKKLAQRYIWLVISCLWLLTLGCLGWRPYHSTSTEALTEFPGYLTKESLNSVEILQQENVADGLVLLYRYPSPVGTVSNGYCVATTFVTEEQNNSWRSQSASRIGCGENYPYIDDFMAMYTVGGNITDLTTAYGFSNRGDEVRIEWSDGLVDVVTLQNGAFLNSRPQILQVQRIELLDKNGEVLESKIWATP